MNRLSAVSYARADEIIATGRQEIEKRLSRLDVGDRISLPKEKNSIAL
jgi:hypothetical protein